MCIRRHRRNGLEYLCRGGGDKFNYDKILYILNFIFLTSQRERVNFQ